MIFFFIYSACSFLPFQYDLWKEIEKVNRNQKVPSPLRLNMTVPINSQRRGTHLFLCQPIPMLKPMLLKNVLSETNYAPFKTDLLLFHSEERPKKKKNYWETSSWHVGVWKAQGQFEGDPGLPGSPPEFALFHKLCSGALVVCQRTYCVVSMACWWIRMRVHCFFVFWGEFAASLGGPCDLLLTHSSQTDG